MRQHIREIFSNVFFLSLLSIWPRPNYYSVAYVHLAKIGWHRAIGPGIYTAAGFRIVFLSVLEHSSPRLLERDAATAPIQYQPSRFCDP
jgi:hypothetical protein